MSALDQLMQQQNNDPVEWLSNRSRTRSRSSNAGEREVGNWQHLRSDGSESRLESGSEQSIRRRRRRSRSRSNLARGINTLRISLRNNHRQRILQRIRRNNEERQQQEDSNNQPYFIIGRNIQNSQSPSDMPIVEGRINPRTESVSISIRLVNNNSQVSGNQRTTRATTQARVATF